MVIFTMIYYLRLWSNDTHIPLHFIFRLVLWPSHLIDYVSCLLHLTITETLLDYSRINRADALEMMMTYLGDDSGKSQHEINNTRWCHARFSFLVKLYEDHLTTIVDALGDDTRDAYHITCALRSCFMVLDKTCIFVDKNVTHVDVVYIKYFINLERINEHN